MKKLNKIISLLMCSAFVFVSCALYAPEAEAKTLSSLRDEYSDIEDKVAESEQRRSLKVRKRIRRRLFLR